jgi:ABC-type multidrug transport system fused ATPase/permease subunit
LFVGLIASATLFQKVVDNSTILYKEFTNEFSSVQKLWDTFSSIPKMKNEFKNIPFKYKSGDIEIKDITFGYTEDRNVFEHFSLNIK